MDSLHEHVAVISDEAFCQPGREAVCELVNSIRGTSTLGTSIRSLLRSSSSQSAFRLPLTSHTYRSWINITSSWTPDGGPLGAEPGNLHLVTQSL